MAYDEGLVFRVAELIEGEPDITEKKMFGGVGFLANGNMACGIHQDSLIVRVGPDLYQESLQGNYVDEFDITGRPMKGWVMIDPLGIEEDDALESWVNKGVSFARTLPAK